MMMSLGISLVLGLQLQTIDVREVVSTRGNPSSPFGTIGGMVEVRPGVAILSDDVHPALHRWIIDSNNVELFARDGRGPGEVVTPTTLARRPDRGFVVYDAGHGGILLFDGNLTFERKIILKGGIVSNPKSIAVLSDGSVVVAGGRMRDARHLHRYDGSGEWRESYGSPPAGLVSNFAKIQTAGGALRVLPRGFLFSFGTPLRIMRSTAARLDSLAVVTEDPQLLPELTESSVHGPPDPELQGAKPFLWWHDRSSGAFLLHDGRILNVVTRYYRGDSVWDLYSGDGRRLARRIVPRAYYAWDLTTDGHVLASYRDPQTDERIAVVLRVSIR